MLIITNGVNSNQKSNIDIESKEELKFVAFPESPTNLQLPSAAHLAGQPGKFNGFAKSKLCLVSVQATWLSRTLCSSPKLKYCGINDSFVLWMSVKRSVFLTCIHKPPSRCHPSWQEPSPRQLWCTQVLCPGDRRCWIFFERFCLSRYFHFLCKCFGCLDQNRSVASRQPAHQHQDPVIGPTFG